MPGITWTKEWAGTDDGTIVGGTDLKNIQDDLATVLTTSDLTVADVLTTSDLTVADVLTTSDLTVADVLTTSDIGVTVQAYAVDKLYLYWENEAVSYENVAVYTT